MTELLTRAAVLACSATTLLPTDVGRAWRAVEDLVDDLWPGAYDVEERYAGSLLKHVISGFAGGPAEGRITWQVVAAAERTSRVTLTIEEDHSARPCELDGLLAQLLNRCLSLE